MTSIADLGRPEWELGRADFRFASTRTSIDAEALNERDVFHYSIPVVQEIGTGRIESGDTIDSSKLLIKSPVVLVSKLNPRKATVCLAEPHAEALTVASGEFVPLDPVQDNINYIYYVWSSELMRQHLSALVKSVTKSHQRCNPADIVKVPWRWPSKLQQEAIAHYLDRRCGEIDDLIAKKRGLLGLLAEKRSALITRAVTKGLDPTAPMKPSGIDWLGHIPAHWEAISFRWRCKILSGQVDPTEEEFSKLPLIAPDFIESGTGVLQEPPSAEEQGAISGKYHFSAGTVVYSKIRPLLAKVCISPYEALCSADMYPIQPSISLDSEFLFFQLLSGHFTSFAVMESLRVAMPKVNRETLGAFPILIPPIDEQAAIVTKIKSETEDIDMSRKLIERAIDQLSEYRAAIITKAVTGELEVT